VRLSVGLPVELPVGLVRLDALGYPLGPPVGRLVRRGCLSRNLRWILAAELRP